MNQDQPSDGEPTVPIRFPFDPPVPGHNTRPRDEGAPAQQSWFPPVNQPPPGYYAPPGPYASPGPYAAQGQPMYGPSTLPIPVYQQPGSPRRSPVSRWVWPAVCALALVVGSLAGLLGGAAYQNWSDDDRPSAGRVSDGLGGVDTQASPPLPPENGSVAAVAEQMLPSTVQILAEYDGTEGAATGSGFVLDRQGHFITNNHVVADAAANDGSIEVVDRDGNHFEAEVVGRSATYDLAVLFVDDAPDLPAAALGASGSMRVGDQVVALGSPLGLSSTVTAGIVSALNRPVTTGDAENDSSYINAVQTDAAINPGNSGGPLVNLRGQVIGVNSAIATTGGALQGEAGNIGVGFAIPIEQVKITADQILKTGEARFPVIGASVVTATDDGDGAEISEVRADSPAEKAGLHDGDIVIAVDDQRVSDGIALIVAIRAHQPGDEVRFAVLRGGREREITVTLGSEVG